MHDILFFKNMSEVNMRQLGNASATVQTLLSRKIPKYLNIFSSDVRKNYFIAGTSVNGLRWYALSVCLSQQWREDYLPNPIKAIFTIPARTKYLSPPIIRAAKTMADPPGIHHGRHGRNFHRPRQAPDFGTSARLPIVIIAYWEYLPGATVVPQCRLYLTSTSPDVLVIRRYL